MANIALEEDGLDNDGTSLNVSTVVDSSSSNNKEDDRVDMSMRWNECIPNRAKPSELPLQVLHQEVLQIFHLDYTAKTVKNLVENKIAKNIVESTD